MLKTWAVASVGLLAFAVLVWFAGPLVVIAGQAPLASAQVRLVVIGIFILQYLAQKIWNAANARRNNERVVSGLQAIADPSSSPEAAQLRERFSTALAELRRARLGMRGGWKFGRSYLYQLPWYVIIGAPGAGKTTALLNSGLEFPLARKLGQGPVGGIGGTRNCDWWFTDRAVLIDTAGRYTTHESDRDADRRAWQTFLQLLARSRPRRPLDGVLLAVSAGDLLEFTPAQLAEHARALRNRLEELQGALKVRLPVYLLLTKCDLLPGFVDWFGPLGRKERDQAWGVTFAGGTENPTAIAGFAASFEGLASRLTDTLVARLRAERDPRRRARIFALAGQLRALGEPLDALLRRTFSSSGPATEASGTALRGVYLTSGTQDGTPIDRMLAAFGRDLGLVGQILPPHARTGKSFFLAGLLNDVVLAETAQVASPLSRKWHRRLVVALSAALLPVAAIVSIWWVTGYSRTVNYISQLDTDVTGVRAVVAASPRLLDPDPRAIAPALDSLRALALSAAVGEQHRKLFAFGSRSHTKLAGAARDAYDRMLLGGFQARIAQAIDTTLRAGADVNVQYEALKAYRMLSDPQHFDAAGLKVFVMSYWDATLVPALNPTERRDLIAHLDAFLEAGAVGSGIRLEPALVDSVRGRLASQSVAQRIQLRLGILLDSAPHADFTVASLGPAAANLFVGADGKSAPVGVPWRYTLEAYRDVVIRNVPVLAAQLAAESSWVLGTSSAGAQSDLAQVMAAYRSGYTQAWGRLLDDLRLRVAANNKDAIQQLQALGSRDGPFAALVSALLAQTPTRMNGGADGPISQTEPAVERIIAVESLTARDTTGSSLLDSALQSFRDLQALRTSGASGGSAGTAAERLARISNDAKRDPEPFRSMLLGLAVLPEDSPALESHASGTALSRQIAGKLGLPCIQLVAGRFPFSRSASRDAGLDEFSRMFAPKGAFDQVFRQFLASRVDTSSDDWEWRGPGGAANGEEVERFRAAARIRAVFFAKGGPQPVVQLTFLPVDLDEDIDRFQLDVDGQTVRYAHGPLVPTTIRWPGPQGKGSAAIVLTPPSAAAPVQFNGPWALFRLMDHAAMREGDSPGQFRVVFDAGGKHASFDVSSDSGANPFRLQELEHFECPLSGQ